MRVIPTLVLLAAAVPPFPAAAPQSALPFVEDNYPQALAAAKSRKVPLFVEAWAPW